MKDIVRESISFKRDLSDEEIKHSILGYHPGEIVISTRWDEKYVFMIINILDDAVDVLYLGHFKIIYYYKDIHSFISSLFLSEIKPISKTQLQDIKEKIADWDIAYIKKLTGITLDI